MLFNSIHYLLFFPAVVVLFYSLPQKYRWILLLAASYYFYASWKVGYLILILLSTTIDYLAAIWMSKCKVALERRKYLLMSLVGNLGLLFVFKYYNFFQESLEFVSMWIHVPYDAPLHKLLLPVGISFYTFQTLSYTIDVYKNRIKPEKHFGYYALYVAFFPQLVAGPIERAAHLLPQFRQRAKFDMRMIVNGLRLMLFGLFMKVVIADNAAVYVNSVYNNIYEFTGLPILLATYFFGFQIFCDFAGYSLIAIGSAKCMGIDIMQNFNRPYLAQSFRDFWRRWHISLSKWLVDYIYIPLGGNRVAKKRRIANVLITFFLSGLWHGAAWTFVLWGIVHAIYLILERVVYSLKPSWEEAKTITMQIVRIVIIFNMVSFAWIFFRANTIRDAFYAITHLFADFSLSSALAGVNTTPAIFALSALLVIGLVAVEVNLEWGKRTFKQLPTYVRWGIYYFLLFGILFLQANQSPQFIYFQF